MRPIRLFVLLFLILLFAASTSAQSPLSPSEPIAKFKQSSSFKPAETLEREGFLGPAAHLNPVEASEVEYLTSHGTRIMVDIVRFRQDGEAYELLSLVAAAARTRHPDLEIRPDYGTAGFATEDEISFFKGRNFIRLRNLKGNSAASLNAFVKEFSQSLAQGEDEIPVLLKHLPNPEEAQKNAVYLTSFVNLDRLGLHQAVLSAVDSGGNADAALASYGPTKVLIVEFNTPQLAADNDQRIIAKIHELWNLGQPAPTAYRRVGNYSVFIFDAPDEQTAKQLIDQVKYEQVVQWLGDNPNILKEAEQRYINTTLGVLIAVLKASGYAFIGCFGIGGLIGALLFSYRRAQQRALTAYSDAGGMLRLNLDEMTSDLTHKQK